MSRSNKTRTKQSRQALSGRETAQIVGVVTALGAMTVAPPSLIIESLDGVLWAADETQELLKTVALYDPLQQRIVTELTGSTNPVTKRPPQARPKPKAFFYHLNKPQWKKTGRVCWSVHHDDRCYIVDRVVCDGVRTETQSRARQPVAVVRGKGFVLIKEGVAYITECPNSPNNQSRRRQSGRLKKSSGS